MRDRQAIRQPNFCVEMRNFFTYLHIPRPVDFLPQPFSPIAKF
jgi:hypothetical protein